MLNIMLASLTMLCIHMPVCASDIDTDSAIIEPAQPTQPRCDRPQCSILVPPTKLKSAHKKKNPKSTGANKKRKAGALSQSVIHFQLLAYYASICS